MSTVTSLRRLLRDMDQLPEAPPLAWSYYAGQWTAQSNRICACWEVIVTPEGEYSINDSDPNLLPMRVASFDSLGVAQAFCAQADFKLPEDEEQDAERWDGMS